MCNQAEEGGRLNAEHTGVASHPEKKIGKGGKKRGWTSGKEDRKSEARKSYPGVREPRVTDRVKREHVHKSAGATNWCRDTNEE